MFISAQFLLCVISFPLFFLVKSNDTNIGIPSVYDSFFLFSSANQNALLRYFCIVVILLSRLYACI
jgi:hypothetical protein